MPTCTYFNSPSGCFNGSSCPNKHVALSGSAGTGMYNGPPQYEQRAQVGAWTPYSDTQNKMIAAAYAKDPNGKVVLQGTRFEVRFGTSASSAKVRRAITGILQVNLDTQNSRDVRLRSGGGANGGNSGSGGGGGGARAAVSPSAPPAPAKAVPAAPIYSHYSPGVLPPNWNQVSRSQMMGGGTAAAIDITTKMKDFIELLMNKTSDPKEHGHGADSHKVKFDKFVVTKVERVQNKSVWAQYNLKKELGEPHSSVLLNGKKKGVQYKTPEPTGLNFRLEDGSVLLDPKRNEHLLFHGTKPDIKDIVELQGFDPRVGGGMLGSGVYFAENASKADQYVPPNKKGEQWMFLARVYLGTPHHTDQDMGKTTRPPCVDGKKCKKKGVGCSHARADSVVFYNSKKRFKEFVVYDSDLAYPEYAVRYERWRGGKKVHK